MAIPSRFLKPAANRSPKKEPGKKPQKMPGTFAGKSTSAVSPTLIGVVLSVFAHTLIIAFGPVPTFRLRPSPKRLKSKIQKKLSFPWSTYHPPIGLDFLALPSLGGHSRSPQALMGLRFPPEYPIRQRVVCLPLVHVRPLVAALKLEDFLQQRHRVRLVAAHPSRLALPQGHSLLLRLALGERPVVVARARRSQRLYFPQAPQNS